LAVVVVAVGGDVLVGVVGDIGRVGEARHLAVGVVGPRVVGVGRSAVGRGVGQVGDTTEVVVAVNARGDSVAGGAGQVIEPVDRGELAVGVVREIRQLAIDGIVALDCARTTEKELVYFFASPPRIALIYFQ
jgi:hypothetical protein